MKKIIGEFEGYDDEPYNILGYQEIMTHMIFDIKKLDFLDMGITYLYFGVIKGQNIDLPTHSNTK